MMKVIQDDAEALAVAADVARSIASTAAQRDADQVLPHDGVELVAKSGLFSLIVPKANGGPGARASTIVEVFRLVAAADPSVAQIAQNHYAPCAAIREWQLDEAVRTFFFGELL